MISKVKPARRLANVATWADLHRAFDEINGLFHVDLCFVFGHHACGRQLFAGMLVQSNTTHRSILPEPGWWPAFPSAVPRLGLRRCRSGDMEVCLGMGLLQGLVNPD